MKYEYNTILKEETYDAFDHLFGRCSSRCGSGNVHEPDQQDGSDGLFPAGRQCEQGDGQSHVCHGG
ncbi:hypothetical protein D3C75_1322600 [compost metagenome]